LVDSNGRNIEREQVSMGDMMTLDEAPPLATPPGASFPKARVPVTPVLSLAAFGRSAGSIPSVLDAGPARLVTSGRVAIALALRQMGVGPGDAVLVPSYHCASMIEPLPRIPVAGGAMPASARPARTCRNAFCRSPVTRNCVTGNSIG
jgi:hypothetical protein